MESLRILLVDDHILFRKGLASLMESQEGVEVVGEASDGIEALEKTRELMPDLILMDIAMPRSNGIEATKQIKEEMPYARIVILTVSDEDEDLFEAIKAGAQGYLLKNLSPETLTELLRGVQRGESPMSPAIAAKLLREFRGKSAKAKESIGAAGVLTMREKEILELVASGASNKEIAVRLCIAPGTVKNHLHNILEKLQLDNRVQAATYAAQVGLIAPSEKLP